MRCVTKGMTTCIDSLNLVCIIIYYLIYIELRHRGTLPLLSLTVIVRQVVLGGIILKLTLCWLFSAPSIFTIDT